MGADLSKLSAANWLHLAIVFLAALASVEGRSPSGGYNPGAADCPSGDIVRPADVSNESIFSVSPSNVFLGHFGRRKSVH